MSTTAQPDVCGLNAQSSDADKVSDNFIFPNADKARSKNVWQH